MKDDGIYVSHIQEALADIKEMTADMDEETFLANKAVRLAVVKSLEIVGEASKNVSESFRKKNPKIPWSDIIKMRDKTVHFYFGINYHMVWEVVERDLPKLEKELAASLK